MDGIVYWHWYALAAVLVILETLVPGVLFLWLAIGAGIAGTLLLVVPDMDPVHQLLVFAVASAIALYLGHRFLRRPPPAAEPGLNRRADALIGQETVLVEAIANGQGRVHLGGSSWKVTGPEAPAGTRVRVAAAEGTLLRVDLA